MKKKYTQIVFSTVLLFGATQVNAENTQLQLSTQVEPSVIHASDTIRVSAFLNTEKEKSNGLGVAIAFDSSKIAFEQFSYTFSPGLLSTSSTVEKDKADIDNNPQTDSLVRVAWIDIMGNWEGIDYENTHLLTAEFFAVSESDSSLTTVTFSSLSNTGTDTFTVVKQLIKVEGDL